MRASPFGLALALLLVTAAPASARSRPVPAPVPPPAPPSAPTGYYAPTPHYAPSYYAPPPRSTSRYSTELYTGFDVRGLYGTGFYGARIGIAPGVDLEHVAIHAALEGFFGSTASGLATGQFRIAPEFLGTWGRVRFGGGPATSFFFIRRATNGHSMWDWSLGLALKLSVDVIQFDERRALYLALTGGIDGFLFSVSKNAGSPALYSGALLVGSRF